MSFKLHLILDVIRCNFPDISYLNETQKNNFQLLNETSAKLHRTHNVYTLGGYTLLTILQLFKIKL